MLHKPIKDCVQFLVEIISTAAAGSPKTSPTKGPAVRNAEVGDFGSKVLVKAFADPDELSDIEPLILYEQSKELYEDSDLLADRWS